MDGKWMDYNNYNYNYNNQRHSNDNDNGKETFDNRNFKIIKFPATYVLKDDMLIMWVYIWWRNSCRVGWDSITHRISG